MISERDIYADKNGKITDDPSEFAFQIAVKGCFVDPRVSQRYGIADLLVATGEPQAIRRVTGRNESSIKIKKAEETAAPQPETKEPQEPADAAGPSTAEGSKPEAEKPTAKKEK